MDDPETPADSKVSWVAPLIVSAVVLGACGTGIVAAMKYKGANPNGPLSEWVPGTITALTLVYSLWQQRKLNKAQRLSEHLQLRSERRQQDADQRREAEDTKRLEREKRALAEKFYVWIEWNPNEGTFGSMPCEVRWSNVSDAPAFNVVATLHLSDDTTEDVHLGTVPPQQRLVSSTLAYSRPRHEPLPAGLVFPKAVSCRFRDANGKRWKRDAAAQLFEDA